MSKIHKLFPKVLAEFNDVCTDEIPNFIKEVEELNERCGTSSTSTLNVNSSHSTIQSIHRLPAFKPLAKVALANAKQFAKAYGHIDILVDRLFISNMWFNVSGKDQYIFPHRHPGSLFSGAYYLESHPSHPENVQQLASYFPDYPTRELSTHPKHQHTTPHPVSTFVMLKE